MENLTIAVYLLILAVFAAAYFVESLVKQLTTLNQNFVAVHPELKMPPRCLEHKCTYYTTYLAAGPADLTHEGFHEAEKAAEAHMWDCSRMKNIVSCSSCDRYETLMRA